MTTFEKIEMVMANEKNRDDQKNAQGKRESSWNERHMDGDEFYACPHLFCEHKVGESPFSKILYVDEFGSAIPQEQIIQFLDIQSEC